MLTGQSIVMLVYSGLRTLAITREQVSLPALTRENPIYRLTFHTGVAKALAHGCRVIIFR